MCNENSLEEQKYIQLKTELNDCIKVRNTLNTFVITTFITVLGLAYNNATNVLSIFLCAQILMIPVLWRIINFKKTEYSLSRVISETFKDPWEKKRSDRNTFYFEFLTLSLFVTGYCWYLFSKVFWNIMTVQFVCALVSSVATVAIFVLSYKSSKLSTDNCDEKWCKLFCDP